VFLEEVPEEDRAFEEIVSLWQDLRLHDQAEPRVDLWDFVDVDNDVAIDETGRETSLVHMDSSSESEDEM
jgi:hypothetical protein